MTVRMMPGGTMSMKKRLRSVLLCLVLCGALSMGVQMRPEEIEELMSAMNKPKIAHTLPDESDDGDKLIKQFKN
jgi:hypothetical protein